MACLIVPVVEATVVTIAKKTAERRLATDSGGKKKRSPYLKKVHWLTNALWGGSALLAFEHIWHGEIVPWFPFLTALKNPADTAEMLHELSTAGVMMAALVTIAWLGVVWVTEGLEKRLPNSLEGVQEV